jgi:chemotaxis protein CheX
MVAEAPAKSGLNVKLLVPFINSIRTVFSTMLGMTATINRPTTKAEPVPMYDVSGIIGFSGDITGQVVVSFQKATAIKLVTAFAGAEMDPASPDFADAIGELTNMIAGAAKKDLGAAAGITCPSVIIGTGHVVARLRDVPCLVVPCETPVGPFCVEISIKQVAKQ